MNQETKRLEAYSIADFVKQIQEAVIEGYQLNLEDNEKYPLQIGVGFYCTMDKSILTTVQEAVENAIVQVTELGAIREFEVVNVPSSKPGRKPKV